MKIKKFSQYLKLACFKGSIMQARHSCKTSNLRAEKSTSDIEAPVLFFNHEFKLWLWNLELPLASSTTIVVFIPSIQILMQIRTYLKLRSAILQGEFGLAEGVGFHKQHFLKTSSKDTHGLFYHWIMWFGH